MTPQDLISAASHLLESLTVSEFDALAPGLRGTVDLGHYAQAHGDHFHTHSFHTEAEANAFLLAYANLLLERATPDMLAAARPRLDELGVDAGTYLKIHAEEGHAPHLDIQQRFTDPEAAHTFLTAMLPHRNQQPGQHRDHNGHDHHAHRHHDHHDDEQEPQHWASQLTQQAERGARFLARQYTSLAKGQLTDGDGIQYDHTDGLHLHGSRVPAEVIAAAGLAVAGSFLASKLDRLPRVARFGIKLATAIPVLRSLVGPELAHAVTHLDTAGGKSDIAKHATFLTMLGADLFQDNASLSLAGNAGVAALSLIGRTQVNAAEALNDLADYLKNVTNEPVDVIHGDHTHETRPDALKPGQVIRLVPGQAIPVDAKIRRILGEDGAERNTVKVNNKVINGQNDEQPLTAGDSVPQGAQILDPDAAAIELEVVHSHQDSYLSQLARNAERHARTPARSQTDVERLATIATYLSLGGGLITAGRHLAHANTHAHGFNLSHFLNDVGEFLAKTSPCGILIAPAALALTRRALANKHQVLSRSLYEMEEVQHLNTLLLDWTGTITENNRVAGVFFADEHGHTLPDAEATAIMQQAAAVEAKAKSQHPIAKAITRAYDADATATITPNSAGKKDREVESVGEGVSATVNGAPLKVGRRGFVAGNGAIPTAVTDWAETQVAQGHSVTFIRRGGQWGAVATSSDIRPDVLQTISYLESQGVEVHIITGDSAETAARKAELLGIPAERIHAGLLPDQKAEIVGQLRAGTLPNGKPRYVGVAGDGLNDIPAMERATTTAHEGEAPGFAFVMHDTDYPKLQNAASFAIRNVSDVASLRETVREPSQKTRQSMIAGGALSTLFGVGHLANLKFGAAIGEVLHEAAVGMQYLLTGVRPAKKAERGFGSWMERANHSTPATGGLSV